MIAKLSEDLSKKVKDIDSLEKALDQQKKKNNVSDFAIVVFVVLNRYK